MMGYWHYERIQGWGQFSINLGRGNGLGSLVDEVLGSL